MYEPSTAGIDIVQNSIHSNCELTLELWVGILKFLRNSGSKAVILKLITTPSRPPFLSYKFQNSKI